MNTEDDILNFLDLLDLDEELIDVRLKSIMVRNNLTNIQLSNAIQLLNYKQLINIKEGTECENIEEFDFLVKLLKFLNEENVSKVCTIFKIVLSLNIKSIVSSCQHFLTQIWCDIEEITGNHNLLMHYFQVCNSILDAILKSGEKIDLLQFANIPTKCVLSSGDEKLAFYFLTTTIPKLFECTSDLHIMDHIWTRIMQSNIEIALKALSWLSDYYLPTTDIRDMRLESEIAFQNEFWELVLQGLLSNDDLLKKISVYLAKRAIDYIYIMNRYVEVKSDSKCILKWNPKDKDTHKNSWDSFFILIDSLEEKQSNIILPSLQLFDALNTIEDCWLHHAFKLGLTHENLQVKRRCIEYKLKNRIASDSDAITLLEALNDIQLYENKTENEEFKAKISVLLTTANSFQYVFNRIPQMNWSPIPLFHLSSVLADLQLKTDWHTHSIDICATIRHMLNIPCNIVVVRKAIHINIAHFIGNCCKHLNCSQYINIYKGFQLENLNDNNPFINVLDNKLSEINEETILQTIFDTDIDVNVVLMYINDNNINIFLNNINDRIKRINDFINRHYSNKLECLEDVIILIKLFKKGKDTKNLETISAMIAREYKTILHYILSLLSSESELSIEDTVMLFKNLDSMSNINDSTVKEMMLQLYKSSMLILTDTNTDLSKTVLSIHILHFLSNNVVLRRYYKQEMISLSKFITIMNNKTFKDVANPQSGRLRNAFYEISSKIVYLQLQTEEKDINVKEMIAYIESVLDCGGYGCLKWILCIINKILPNILDTDDVSFNLTQFLNKMWKEIDELKSNNQYAPCMKEFIHLIMQDSILMKPVYNNIILSYCVKIVDYGPVKNTPLYYLVKEINLKNVIDGQLVYVISDILLYSPVPRRDQRIADNLVIDILNDPKYGLEGDVGDSHFNYEIQYLSLVTLSNINDDNILDIITSLIMKKVDDAFKNKQRYHGNSQAHRFLLMAVQNLVILLLKRPNVEKTMQWCLILLGKLPHQPSVRICLEWYIAVYLYTTKTSLNNETLQMLKSNNIPLISEMSIIYWVIKHKILTKNYSEEEYEFVMDTLLSHTMGQLFTVRLHAQYLTTKLYGLESRDKYIYIIKVIENTFVDNSTDKHYNKLKEEYFANEFDIVGNITPYFLYYFLPRYFDNFCNEHINLDFVRNVCEDVEQGFIRNNSEEFKEEWKKFKFTHKVDNCLNKNVEHKTKEDVECLGTIQKKYIPWKNMSDVGFDGVKKRECRSELIVVASLIDKLPNLGGMARTGEVFGVRTYVIDNISRLQDKQFQGLSVSAERWIDVEEVRPGLPLKEYLLRKKAEGYCVVAAEQTSTSCSLQGFTFPKKSLLLLGHEKEGIPCDMLPLMDFCVEIPQQGYVRSLNVHVTAAIFIWEYARQNIL